MSNTRTQEEEKEDVISNAIGEYGRWQLQITFLLSLFNIPCTWHIFAPTFHAAPRDIWCSRPSDLPNIEPTLWKNLTQPNDYCTILNYKSVNYTMDDINNIVNLSENNLVKCDSWEYSGIGETIVSEFDLVCDKEQLIHISEMMFLGGVAFGGLICGMFSDRYGRKRTLMASVFVQALLGTLIAFVPWFEGYYILRASLGFISSSVVFTGFVLSIEVVGGNWRTVAGISYLFPVSLGYATMAGIAYLLRDWRQLQLVISLPGFLFLALWWIIPESPRWLLATGKPKKVLIILQNAAIVNGRVLPENIDKQLLPSAVIENESAQVMDLFRIKKLRRITLFSLVFWFSTYVVYYGLVFNIGNIGGDLYVSSILAGIVEIPAVAVSIFFLLRMGRRWPLSLTMIFAGVACLLTLPLPYLFDNVQWLRTSLALAGKLLISSSNAVMPVFTAELYPTTIRNIGMGANNVLAGIALMLVPYLWELTGIYQGLPMIIMGVCGIVGGLCVLPLPETGNVPLKDTVSKKPEVTETEIVRNELDLKRTIHV